MCFGHTIGMIVALRRDITSLALNDTRIRIHNIDVCILQTATLFIDVISFTCHLALLYLCICLNALRFANYLRSTQDEEIKSLIGKFFFAKATVGLGLILGPGKGNSVLRRLGHG
jgi:hypothetical protein